MRTLFGEMLKRRRFIPKCWLEESDSCENGPFKQIFKMSDKEQFFRSVMASQQSSKGLPSLETRSASVEHHGLMNLSSLQKNPFSNSQFTKTESKPYAATPAIVVVQQEKPKEILQASQECIPVELSFPSKYLINSLEIADPSKTDEVMRMLCDAFKGTLKPHKGCFKAKLEDGTMMKVASLKDSKNNCVFIEFNCIEGSPFTFQQAFVKAKIMAIPYLNVPSQTEFRLATEAQLKTVEQKANIWLGNTTY